MVIFMNRVLKIKNLKVILIQRKKYDIHVDDIQIQDKCTHKQIENIYIGRISLICDNYDIIYKYIKINLIFKIVLNSNNNINKRHTKVCFPYKNFRKFFDKSSIDSLFIVFTCKIKKRNLKINWNVLILICIRGLVLFDV